MGGSIFLIFVFKNGGYAITVDQLMDITFFPFFLSFFILSCYMFCISSLKPLGAIVQYLLLKTPEQGSQTSLYCSVAKEVEGQAGAYYDVCRVAKPTKIALDDEECRKLWEYSMKVLQLE